MRALVGVTAALLTACDPSCPTEGCVPDAAQPDGGSDAAMEDAGSEDAGPPGIAAPLLRSPRNGARTGSVHAPLDDAALIDHPRRPRFAWDAVPGASRYQLQLDDSCTARERASCTLPSPELDVVVESPGASEGPVWFRAPDALAASTTAPVGTRYVWRVRACAEECGPWSAVRYLDVGRAHGDLNGDGYSDLVVGAPAIDGALPDEGVVAAFYGGPDGPSGAPDLLLSTPGSYQLGRSISSDGDLDGDGFDDLAVGMSEAVEIYLGGASGIASSPDHELDRSSGEYLALSTGSDLNDDGLADLVVGAPFDRGPEGAVYVYYGGALDEAPIRLERTGPRFMGGALTSRSDIDGDGLGDLVTSTESDLYGFRGGPSGVPRAPSWVVPVPAETTLVVSGGTDLDGDGFDDVVIGGEHGFDVPGAALAYRGGRAGLGAEAPQRFSSPSGGSYGSAIASGDVDGDGRPELFIGAPTSTHVYRGGSIDPDTAPQIALLAPTGSAFGFQSAMSARADLDGDGYGELVVADTGHGDDAGAVFVYRGSAEGIATGAIPDFTLDSPSAEKFGFIGVTVAP